MSTSVQLYYARFLDNYVLIGLGSSTQAALRLFDFEPLALPVSDYLQALKDNPDTLLEQQQIDVQSPYDEALTLQKLGDRVRALLRQYDENQVMVMLMSSTSKIEEEL